MIGISQTFVSMCPGGCSSSSLREPETNSADRVTEKWVAES